QHLHLDEVALAVELVAGLLREREDDRGHALKVDDVERDRQIAGAAAGDGEPLRLRAPVEVVAEQIAEGLAQEVERHLEAAFALHRRLREGDDGVAHGDDGVALPDHHLLVGDLQRYALARGVRRKRTAEGLGERREAERRPVAGEDDGNGDLATLQHHGGAGRDGLSALGRDEHRQKETEERGKGPDTAVFHSRRGYHRGRAGERL